MVGTNNAANISSQGTVYFNGTGTFSGVDGSTSGKVLTSNGTGLAPSFQTIAAGITTINGDSGSITGSTVTIYANNAGNICGQSVLFSCSGIESSLTLTNANGSTYIGNGSGNGSGTNDVALGKGNLTSSTAGNVAIGTGALVKAGTGNVGVGYQALNSFAGTSGNYNIAIGYQAGTNYTGSESSNILLNNPGVAAESNTLRIGAATGTGTQQISTVFIYGINGVTASNPVLVTIDSSASQLGTQALTQYNVLSGGASNAINFIAPGSNTNAVLTSNGASAQPTFQANIVPRVASLQTSPSNPTGTTSTAAFKMMGLGSTWKLTPTAYTVVRVTIDGQCTNNTNGDGVQILVAYGTGTAPANAAAASGTTVGSTITWTALTSLLTNGVPFAKDVIITGLSAGTAYWFDIQLQAVTGGTASILNLEVTAQELTS